MSAREMRAWMTTWKDLVRRAAEIRKLNGQAQRIAREVEESRKTLLDRFAVLCEQAPPEGSSLEVILLRAEEVVQSEKDLKTERETLEKKIEETIWKKTKAEEEEKRREEEFAEWKKNWAAAIKGLSEGLPVSAASVFLDKCAALWKKLDDVEKDKRRVEGMKRDIEEFQRKVAEFATRYAPDLAAVPADEAVRGISARVSRAKADVASRAGLCSERVSRKSDLDKAREAISQTSEHLAGLRQEAGCETDEELSDAEMRSELACSLDRRISELTRQLLVLAAGTKISDFVGKVEEEDPEQIQPELAKMEADLAEARDEFDRVGPNLGITSERLRAMDGSPNAALAAQEAQAGLASLTNNLERYLRVRLAAKILQTEIERYRERSQGPVLRRAAELFALVTEGRFVSLEPDYGSGDEPVLVGVRESGERVALVGMSDGTQDQLYLALRLASLERFSAGSEPLPLLVDDALVNFDDERARAALKVFGDLTKTTQVIFFTHHRHMKRLAEEAVDDRILHIQDLVET